MTDKIDDNATVDVPVNTTRKLWSPPIMWILSESDLKGKPQSRVAESGTIYGPVS